MSTMMNVQSGVRLDRLRLLADYLEFQVTDEHFHMGFWGDGSNPKSDDFCGCAGGHATAVFSGDGLYLDNLEYGNMIRNRHDTTYRNSFDILGHFFGLSPSDSLDLFLGSSRTRLEEVQIIREFIAKQETTP